MTSPLVPLTLDVFDRQLLLEVQQDNRMPLRLLAEKVHLSTAAVQRRIRRMEEAGVISSNVAVVSPASVGKVITLLVEVQAERTQTADLDELKKSLSGPEVQQCYYVTGEADFMLVMTVDSMTEYEALARHMFYDNKNIKSFRTIVVMDRVKVGLTVPVVSA